MASTQPELDPEEYTRRFEEAFELRMPPYDFRVWNRYLFSRCSDSEEVLGLMNLFKWLMKAGDYSTNANAIGQFCMNGRAFITAVKNIIEMTQGTYWDQEEVARDLAFIEKKGELFEAGPIPGLSEVNQEQKEKWLIQAKSCIVSKNPDTHPPIEIISREWYAKQEAYFSFGVLAWNIQLEAKWGLQDPRLDVWYNLGFGIATQEKPAAELLSQYRKRFSSESVKFEYFLYYWYRHELAEQLQKDLESEHFIFWGHLTKFYQSGFTKQQESVFRLYQAVSLKDGDYLPLLKERNRGVFEQAIKSYQLVDIRRKKIGRLSFESSSFIKS
jgi:hypothetical protein